MKTIHSIPFNRLSNEAHYEFMTESNQLFAGVQGIEPLMSQWNTAYSNEGEALNFIRKSAITAQIAQADEQRDELARGLVLLIEANCFHFTPAIKEAASRLKVVTDTYGNIAIKTYDAETAAINSLIAEFNATHAADVAVLNLAPWLGELQNRNNAFASLMAGRYTETAGKTPLRMADARKQAELTYRKIVQRIEALIEINGLESFATLVAELNARVERFSNLTRHRQAPEPPQA